jgi:CO dehydrogenase/acetyl-CoA synthase beta subunit
MMTYLEELCYREKVRLEYISDKVLGKPEKKRVIKVHEVFKNCPNEVAEAVVKYYLDPNKNKVEIKIIVEYLKEKCSPVTTTTKDNEECTENEEKKNMIADENRDDEYQEVTIANMEVKSLYRDEGFSSGSQVIKFQDNDVLELKIIVEPPLT